MTRETAAEQNAERQDEILCLHDAHPLSFHEVLKMTSNKNFELTKVDPATGMFTLYDRDESEKYEVYNDFGDDVEDRHYSLDRVVQEVRFKVDRRQEYERQTAVKRNALAKLDPKNEHC